MIVGLFEKINRGRSVRSLAGVAVGSVLRVGSSPHGLCCRPGSCCGSREICAGCGKWKYLVSSLIGFQYRTMQIPSIAQMCLAMLPAAPFPPQKSRQMVIIGCNVSRQARLFCCGPVTPDVICAVRYTYIGGDTCSAAKPTREVKQENVTHPTVGNILPCGPPPP